MDAQDNTLNPKGLPRTEALALLRCVIPAASRAWLITHAHETLTDEQARVFNTLIKRRLDGEPIAYILGYREFYSLEFKVTPDVLIPRPDTETLVDAALELIPNSLTSPHPPPAEGRGSALRVLDLGTGSGAVAIAIAHHRPFAQVTAVDTSPAALAVAGENAARLASGNVRLLPSDWFNALEGKQFDLIVSNPPYINAGDPHLQQGDLRFEPPGALASGDDGLDAIRIIVREAPQHLASGGWLLLEHGYDQAERVSGLMRAAGFREVQSRPDIAGIMRVTLALM